MGANKKVDFRVNEREGVFFRKNREERQEKRPFSRRGPGRPQATRRVAPHGLAASSFTVVSLSSGKVSRVRFLNCTSWGTLFSCSCSPMGASLINSGFGS